jgi:hypothetical protein
LFWRRGSIGGEGVQNFKNIGVAGHHPSVQERIPVNGIFPAKALKQRIRIGENYRIEQMVET